MIDKFLEYLVAEKRYSGNTVASYRRDLTDFAQFLLESEGSENMVNADAKIIRNFMAHLSENNFTKRSINRKLSTLRSFYLFLLKIQEIAVSPVESIKSLKFYPEKQTPISMEEMDLLQTQREDDDSVEMLIVETLYQTGMRRMELCTLLFQNVDFSKNEFKVIGKGNKTRLVPFSENFGQRLKEYVLKQRMPNEDVKHLFFVNIHGKKITEKFVYLAVKSYLSLVTSKQKKSPHILRHSFATHVLEKGAEISKVKAILGHASLASTQVYTHANIEQLKNVYLNSHPRELQMRSQEGNKAHTEDAQKTNIEESET